MILNKSLLLKCLGGVAACAGVAGVGIFGSQSGLGGTTSKEDGQLPQSQQDNTKLTEKAGLNCNDSTKECTLKTNSKINVKHDQTKEEGKSFTSSTSGSGKIKLQTENGNTEENPKLVIEGGDISLTGEGSQITKLEQFETYEIEEEGSGDNKKYFLSRKTKAAEGIRKELGLPDTCTLPESSNQECTELDETKLKAINFEGKTQGQEITVSGTATLTVSKETSNEDFPYDYKFTFKGKDTDASLTINSTKITLKSGEGTEFRIKKGASGNSITLEEAWSLTRLLEKVGLSGCTTENTTECSISNGGLNVKQDSNSQENKTKDTNNGASSGKIKVYKENSSTNYNKGFKFVIEEGDISFGSGETISKLEQFETYEIKKEDSSSKWYLTRKSKAADEIKKALGLPTDNCNLPTEESKPSTCCDLDETKLKAINFDGKGDNEPSITSGGTATLTITKTSDTTAFPIGYKLSFDPTETVTISSTSSIKIMKKTNTEFKIKVTKSSGTTPVKLSLEKAWTVAELGKKVGLNCQNSDKKCSFTDGSINVKNGENNGTIEGAKVKTEGSGDKKLKYEEDQEGYNQGIKFTVDGDAAIELTKEGDDTKTLNIENNSNSYEIKKDDSDSKWYLTKKTNSGSSQ